MSSSRTAQDNIPRHILWVFSYFMDPAVPVRAHTARACSPGHPARLEKVPRRYHWGVQARGFLFLWKEGGFLACLGAERQPELWEQLDLAGREPLLAWHSRWAAAEIQCRFLGANELTFQSFFQQSSSCQPEWKWSFPPDLACILLFWTYTTLRFVSKCPMWCGYVPAFVLPIQNLPLMSYTLFCTNAMLV